MGEVEKRLKDLGVNRWKNIVSWSKLTETYAVRKKDPPLRFRNTRNLAGGAVNQVQNDQRPVIIGSKVQESSSIPFGNRRLILTSFIGPERRRSTGPLGTGGMKFIIRKFDLSPIDKPALIHAIKNNDSTIVSRVVAETGLSH
ncbi:hypothetical protein TNCV_1899291 [Trichonephila clavipes]|nr:hypothetical protein TNCV_1899291 [Trichonephila clavipes]